MKALFTKYINIESVLVEMDTLNLSVDQRHHLTSLIDNSMHHAILDEILTSLSPQDKKIFLHHLQSGDEKNIMDFLNKQVDNIEERIKSASEKLVVQLHVDIKEAKRVSHD